MANSSDTPVSLGTRGPGYWDCDCGRECRHKEGPKRLPNCRAEWVPRTPTPPRPAIQPHPLIDFADRWGLDGDYVRCRACRRPQQTSWLRFDFPHASGCRNEGAERNPWLTLSSLIVAQLAKAKEPEVSDA